MVQLTYKNDFKATSKKPLIKQNKEKLVELKLNKNGIIVTESELGGMKRVMAMLGLRNKTDYVEYCISKVTECHIGDVVD